MRQRGRWRARYNPSNLENSDGLGASIMRSRGSGRPWWLGGLKGIAWPPSCETYSEPCGTSSYAVRIACHLSFLAVLLGRACL